MVNPYKTPYTDDVTANMAIGSNEQTGRELAPTPVEWGEASLNPATSAPPNRRWYHLDSDYLGHLVGRWTIIIGWLLALPASILGFCIRLDGADFDQVEFGIGSTSLGDILLGTFVNCLAVILLAHIFNFLLGSYRVLLYALIAAAIIMASIDIITTIPDNSDFLGASPSDKERALERTADARQSRCESIALQVKDYYDSNGRYPTSLRAILTPSFPGSDSSEYGYKWHRYHQLHILEDGFLVWIDPSASELEDAVAGFRKVAPEATSNAIADASMRHTWEPYPHSELTQHLKHTQAHLREQARLTILELGEHLRDHIDKPSLPPLPVPDSHSFVSAVKDPWGKPYQLRLLGERTFIILSLGRDAMPGGHGPDADPWGGWSWSSGRWMGLPPQAMKDALCPTASLLAKQNIDVKGACARALESSSHHLDPWGNLILLSGQGDTPTATSAGPDGVFHSADDRNMTATEQTEWLEKRKREEEADYRRMEEEHAQRKEKLLAARRQASHDEKELSFVPRTSREFTGRAWQDGKQDDAWPFTIRFTSFDERTNEFHGELHWSTFDAITRIEGKLCPSSLNNRLALTFEEVEFVREGNVLLRCSYHLRWNRDTNAPSGTWSSPGGQWGHIEFDSLSSDWNGSPQR